MGGSGWVFLGFGGFGMVCEKVRAGLGSSGLGRVLSGVGRCGRAHDRTGMLREAPTKISKSRLAREASNVEAHLP